MSGLNSELFSAALTLRTMFCPASEEVMKLMATMVEEVVTSARS